jgi:hypothetical protein
MSVGHVRQRGEQGKRGRPESLQVVQQHDERVSAHRSTHTLDGRERCALGGLQGAG